MTNEELLNRLFYITKAITARAKRGIKPGHLHTVLDSDSAIPIHARANIILNDIADAVKSKIDEIIDAVRADDEKDKAKESKRQAKKLSRINLDAYDIRNIPAKHRNKMINAGIVNKKDIHKFLCNPERVRGIGEKTFREIASALLEKETELRKKRQLAYEKKMIKREAEFLNDPSAKKDLERYWSMRPVSARPEEFRHLP